MVMVTLGAPAGQPRVIPPLAPLPVATAAGGFATAARQPRPARHARSFAGRVTAVLSPKVIADLCLLIDAALIGLSGFVWHVVYYRYVLDLRPDYFTYAAVSLVAATLFFVLSAHVCGIGFASLASFSDLLARTLLALLLTVLCLLLLAFMTKTSAAYSRGSFLGWTASSLLLLVAASHGFAHHGRRSRWLERCIRRDVVLVGATDSAARFLEHLRRRGENDLRVGGIFDECSEPARRSRTIDWRSCPYLGDLDDLAAYTLAHRVDAIFIALPWQAGRRIEALVKRLEHLPVDIKLCPDQVAYAKWPLRSESLAGTLTLTVRAQPIRDWGRIAKSAFDLAASALLLVFLAPLLGLIALAIKLGSPGPVLFRQRRQGFNQNVFDLYKFRTMRHRPGAVFAQACPGDPRITRAGRWLRLTSLDELPQLFNVLRGEMSFVGPRPHPVALNAAYVERIERYAVRHRVKPGITGWAQVNGWRGATDTEAKMAGRVGHDLYYIEHWSLLLDLKIILMTCLTGFACNNAH